MHLFVHPELGLDQDVAAVEGDLKAPPDCNKQYDMEGGDLPTASHGIKVGRFGGARFYVLHE